MIKIRQCKACRIMQESDLMHKITLEYKEKKLFLNPDSKTLGKSVYLCKKNDCIKLFLKKKGFRGNFKNIDSSNVEAELLSHIDV